MTESASLISYAAVGLRVFFARAGMLSIENATFTRFQRGFFRWLVDISKLRNVENFTHNFNNLLRFRLSLATEEIRECWTFLLDEIGDNPLAETGGWSSSTGTGDFPHAGPYYL